MRISRAEDGETFDVNATLEDIEQKHDSLKTFLHEITGVDRDFVISFLSDGRQLRDENLRELSGVEDQSIFVYNRDFLEAASFDQVLEFLRVSPQLQPDIDPDASRTTLPSILAAYSRAANFHHQHILHTFASLSVQVQSLRIASSNLDTHVFSLNEAFESFAAMAKRELDRQEGVLRGHKMDMQVIARVGVHVDFLSAHVRKAVEHSGRERMLADYVSSAKMAMVAASCEKLRDELLQRFQQTQHELSELSAGADEVRNSIMSNFEVEAEPIAARSKEIFDRITDSMYDQDVQLQEVVDLDQQLRFDVRRMADIKNRSVAHTMTLLRFVSKLQSDYTTLPPVLIALESDFRLKAGFPHLQRLHNMLYAYGATLIEVVRRKEFAKLFMDRAQILAEMMAKVTANERKRRQIYRSEVHGQLPFETKIMEETPPSLEITTTGVSSSRTDADSRSLGRGDIMAFFSLMDELEASIPYQGSVAPMSPTSQGDEGSEALASRSAVHPIREIRSSLDKLMAKMDGLDNEFDRLAEKSFLSASRLAQSKRRTLTEASAYREAIEQLQEKLEQERMLREDRELQEDELRQLRNDALETATLRERVEAMEAEVRAQREENEQQKARASSELKIQLQRAERLEEEAQAQRERAATQRERAEALEEELRAARDQFTSESAARRTAEARYQALVAEVSSQTQTLESALADANQHTRAEQVLRAELAQVRDEAQKARDQNRQDDERLQGLLVELSGTLTKLEESRVRGEDLEGQIKVAREEGDSASAALRQVTEEKERLLKNQASEANRTLRDHIAEADGDRAVYELRFSEMTRALNNKTKEVEEIKADLEVAKIREEEAKKLAKDTDSLKKKLAASGQMIGSLVTASAALRNAALKASSTAQGFITASSKATSDSTIMSGPPRSPLSTEVMDARGLSLSTFALTEATSPETALQALQNFDFDGFSESINKMGSTIRKWQKQTKEYRERAKGKITFRDFGRGDLALFLPTRNSQAKPWAAFNVSFPHYFLQADPHLAEQLKTREWIVARITSITERVADQKVQESNPYGLGDGVKFYMLEVEDWTQPASTVSPSSSRRQPSGTKSSKRHTNSDRTSTWPSVTAIAQSSPPVIENLDESAPQPPPFTNAVRAPSPARRFLETIRHQSPTRSVGASNGTKPSIVTAQGRNGTSNQENESHNPFPAAASAGSPIASSTTEGTLLAGATKGSGGGLPPSALLPAASNSNSLAKRSPSVASISSSRPPSVFAVGKMPAFGTSPGRSGLHGGAPKGVPTTAISSDIPPASSGLTVQQERDRITPGSSERSGENAAAGLFSSSPGQITFGVEPDQTPSPADSASEGMSSVLLGRRRATSTTSNVAGIGQNFIPNVPVGSTWATLASTLGIGRRRTTTPATGPGKPVDAGLSEDESEVGVRARAARELLRRYDVGSSSGAHS